MNKIMKGQESGRETTKPAPKKRTRPTKNWREKVLKALRETGNITDSCRRAGINKDTFYQHRDKDPEFAAALAEAIEASIENLELEARRRAAKGCKRPVYQQGRLVGYVQEYSDTLLIFLLKAHKPEKYRERYAIKHGGELEIHEVVETVVRTREEAAKAISDLPKASGLPGPCSYPPRPCSYPPQSARERQ
jgi:hypothetical protein